MSISIQLTESENFTYVVANQGTVDLDPKLRLFTRSNLHLTNFTILLQMMIS